MSDLLVIDGLGFGAAGLVLATFCMRSMSALRWVGIASNVLFIAYGYLGELAPVLMLHTLLLPINICRLVQLRCTHVRSNLASESGTPRTQRRLPSREEASSHRRQGGSPDPDRSGQDRRRADLTRCDRWLCRYTDFPGARPPIATRSTRSAHAPRA